MAQWNDESFPSTVDEMRVFLNGKRESGDCVWQQLVASAKSALRDNKFFPSSENATKLANETLEFYLKEYVKERNAPVQPSENWMTTLNACMQFVLGEWADMRDKRGNPDYALPLVN